MNTGTLLWIVSRCAGFGATALLTLAVILGIAVARGLQVPGIPRQVIPATHRSVSLFAVLATVIHVATIIADPYAQLHLSDAIVPFMAENDTLFSGMGTLAIDIALLIAFTSLIRNQLSPRVWRAIHLTAYLFFPIAVIHGIGSGSDTSLAGVMIFTSTEIGLFATIFTYHLMRRPDRAFAH